MFTRNLPILLVFGAALVIGVGVIIVALAQGDDGGEGPSLSDFKAAQAAKSAYFTSDPTVAAASCDTTHWEAGTDTWEVECTIEREGGTTETTLWRVTPDGVATQVEASSDA